jgi:hypothetical protein
MTHSLSKGHGVATHKCLKVELKLKLASYGWAKVEEYNPDLHAPKKVD